MFKVVAAHGGQSFCVERERVVSAVSEEAGQLPRITGLNCVCKWRGDMWGYIRAFQSVRRMLQRSAPHSPLCTLCTRVAQPLEQLLLRRLHPHKLLDVCGAVLAAAIAAVGTRVHRDRAPVRFLCFQRGSVDEIWVGWMDRCHPSSASAADEWKHVQRKHVQATHPATPPHHIPHPIQTLTSPRSAGPRRYPPKS